MPFPVAHGLIGASVVAALLPSHRSRIAKPLLIGAFLGISPDFDYALNWLRISGGGWHHGFTHSIPFAFVLGLVMIVLTRDWKARSFIVFSAAFASHTLLDYLITESQGVALWWPFTDHRYKLRLPNPIDYSLSDASLWATTVDIIKLGLMELLIFGPVLLIIVLIRRAVVKRSRLKQSVGFSISVLVITFLATSSVFAQDKQRIIEWAEPWPDGLLKSAEKTVVSQIEVLEIIDVAVAGKSVEFGKSFNADDEWLKNLTVRIKNVSDRSISIVQLNLFLPQIMPGGPMMSLCYGCGGVGDGQSIKPGDEVEMKVVFYDWLVGQIRSRTILSEITRAEIQDMIVTLHDGKVLYSRRVKTVNKN